MLDLPFVFESVARAVTTVRMLSVAALIVLAIGIALFVRWRRQPQRRGCHLSMTDLDAEQDRIHTFLSSRRIALVGASSDPGHFSRLVMRELMSHGIDVIPIHPRAKTIAGTRAYHQVGEVADFVNGALIMTPAAAAAGVVEACGKAGIKRVWLHQGVGQGAVSDEAIHVAHRFGIALVAGRCPLMFLEPHTSSVHGLHAAWLRLCKRYPRAPTPGSGTRTLTK